VKKREKKQIIRHLIFRLHVYLNDIQLFKIQKTKKTSVDDLVVQANNLDFMVSIQTVLFGENGQILKLIIMDKSGIFNNNQ